MAGKRSHSDKPTTKTGASRKAKSKSTYDESEENLSAQQIEKHTAREYMPKNVTLKSLREAAAHCQACDLYKHATQTVFGDGNSKARVMFVGEQPGDAEDKEGEPFVGPAGKLLRKAMEEAGIADGDVYFTNAVKHFKFEQRGKRRIHAKPRRVEVLSCLPWLQSEIQQIKPNVVVLLGATAAQAVMGTSFRITKERGRPLASSLAPHVVATVHPSSILRAPDDETRHAEMEQFIDDLKGIKRLIDSHGE